MAPRTEKRIWLSLFAPATAWSVQELASAVVGYAACYERAAGAGRAAMIVISVVALAAALGSAVVALRRYRALADDARLADVSASSREEFLAFFAFALAVVFAIGIFWTALPVLVVADVCGAQR